MDSFFESVTVNAVLVFFFKIVYLGIAIAVPVYLSKKFWKKWKAYVRAQFFAKQKYVVLELKIPKGSTKSPLAMEVFMHCLNQTGGEGTNYDKFWLGKSRTMFSLEIVSNGGDVSFLIWTRETFQAIVENNLYSQFPDIEIRVVDDYAFDTPYDGSGDIEMFACDFVKNKDSHYPIKTYVQYGLDKDPDEEFKVDPITPVIETLGSLQKGEQIWIQIGVRAHKKEIPKPDTWFEKVDWEHFAKDEIKKLMKRDEKPKEGQLKIEELSMTKGEKEKVEAIEKNISKIAFDCGIRVIYLGKKDKVRGTFVPAVTGIFKQYNTTNLNGFKPANATSFDYPWQDRSGKKLIQHKKAMLYLYKYRYFFFDEFFPTQYKTMFTKKDYDYQPFVLSVEELASLYHFPGDVSRTPSLSRINAKKVEPPANLPV